MRSSNSVTRIYKARQHRWVLGHRHEDASRKISRYRHDGDTAPLWWHLRSWVIAGPDVHLHP